jgi:type II secretory pathway pseudopilin PulG
MSTLMDQARTKVPRFAEAAVERARLTVVPRPRLGRSGRAARIPFVTLVSLLLVGGVAGLLFFNTSMQQASFKATALEQRAQVLDAQRQSLQMQLDTLRNPQRVALQARRMGMVPPRSPAFIRLGDGKVLGDPMPATADDGFRVTALPTRKPARLRPSPFVVHEPAGTTPDGTAGSTTGTANGAATGTAASGRGTSETRTGTTQSQETAR